MSAAYEEAERFIEKTKGKSNKIQTEETLTKSEGAKKYEGRYIAISEIKEEKKMKVEVLDSEYITKKELVGSKVRTQTGMYPCTSVEGQYVRKDGSLRFAVLLSKSKARFTVWKKYDTVYFN